MDELLLFAALIVLTIFVGSVLGIIAFSRTRELRQRVEHLEAALRAAAVDLVRTAQLRRLDTLTIETVNGEFVLGTPIGHSLRAAGFTESPRGLTLRKGRTGTATSEREQARA